MVIGLCLVPCYLHLGHSVHDGSCVSSVVPAAVDIYCHRENEPPWSPARMNADVTQHHERQRPEIVLL